MDFGEALGVGTTGASVSGELTGAVVPVGVGTTGASVSGEVTGAVVTVGVGTTGACVPGRIGDELGELDGASVDGATGDAVCVVGTGASVSSGGIGEFVGTRTGGVVGFGGNIEI